MMAPAATQVEVRAEAPSDRDAIRAVHLAAFPGPGEARLVDALRDAAKDTVSLVAAADGDVVGHVLFIPVAIDGLPTGAATGLAPLSVQLAYRRRGIGARLVGAGLDTCRRQGFVAAVVLGDPAYYRRFGFVPARRFGLSSEFDVPDDVFMAIELRPGALARTTGIVRYAQEFRSL